MNKLRNMAKENKPAVGTFLSSGNMAVMECLGYTGMDFVIIDTEHGPFDTETMMNLIRTAELVDLVPVVRIANVDHKEIQRAADCGAQGIIAPCLRTMDEFKKLIDLAKYTPLGNRGFIKGRGTGYGNKPWADTATLEEYYANSNERLMVIPQCETVEALDIIEDVVALEGIDGIFIGPFDLSTTMGIPGQFSHPDFKAALERVRKACEGAGKPCYIFSTSVEDTVAKIREGYAGVAHNCDFVVIADAYKKLVGDIRTGAEI